MQRQQRGSCGMAGWVRLRGTLQVRPCKLGRAIHGAHAPATGPTPPSTDLRNLSEWHDLLLVGVDLGRHVDPRHAWMRFVQLSKYSISISIEMDPRSPAICRRWGVVGLRGVRGMGPRHASGGLGRTPNPGLAVCAGQRTRASGGPAFMDGFTASPQSDTAPLNPQITQSRLLLRLLLLLRPLRVPGAARPNPRYLNSCAVMPSGRACSSMCRVMALAPNICSAS